MQIIEEIGSFVQIWMKQFTYVYRKNHTNINVYLIKNL